MAKKSAASLSVVPAIPAKDQRLSPPAFLSDRQRELWIEIVASRPANWFTVDMQSLLVGYVKAITSHELLSRRVDLMEQCCEPLQLKDEDKLYGMVERQARLIQTFATKMRLTQQSRYTAATAAVVAGRASGVRPWDEGK